ncbi:MAG: AMP-binding protein [Acidimicrobiales bacterium]
MAALTTLGALVPAVAGRTPDRPALRESGTGLTWSDVEDRTGRLAAALAGVGVRAGDRVAVLHRKSADAFVAMHAIVRAGAVAVPVDPRAPTDYGRSVVAAAGCRVVVSHPPCAAAAIALAAAADLAAVIGVDRPRDEGDGAGADGTTCRSAAATIHLVGPEEVSAHEPIGPTSVGADDPAYIITTSGSTGRPKGICHTHASALAYVAFKRAAYDFTADDRIGDIAPNHFDISTQALWVTPAIGATNIVVPEPHQMLPASLAQLMAQEAMTVWYGVPYLLSQLATRGDLAANDLSALRWVLFGGEVLAPSVLRTLMAALPGARFSNVYGPAEVNACTVHHLEAPPADGVDAVPIGAPVGRSVVRLVDGEIQVSAPTMMRGYWGRPELDADAFVDDGGRRWYRTGDLAHRRHDGALVFDGRIDHQVKVRGHRVELEAVEAAVEDLIGGSAVVALVGDHLVAGLVGTELPTADQAELQGRLGQRLPPYAIPARFHPLSSVPTTGSGKLDRRAMRQELADAEKADAEHADAEQAARSDTGGKRTV